MRLFWIIVAILFFVVPIVLNVIIGAPNPLSNIDIVGNDVDWLAFYGAYIGGVLSAIIGFLTMWQSSRHNTLNIMIHKQETYIKELSHHLALRIAEFNFWNIANAALYTDAELLKNKSVIQNELNAELKTITEHYNAWGLFFSDSGKNEIKEFNSAYNRCVLKYQEDADDVTREIAKVNNPADVIEFKDWLKSFCSTLDEDKKYVLDLMDKGKEIIQLENEILAKLSKENKKIFPQIPQY